MKRLDVKILAVFSVYFIYFLFGFVSNGLKEEDYKKKAKVRADSNKNGKLETEEVLAVYKSFDYNGEKILSTVGSYENQAILVAKLAQMESNQKYIEEFTVDSIKSFNPWDLVRSLADNDKNGKLSFEEGAIALIKFCESYPNQSCPFRLTAQRPTSGLSEFLFQIFFNLPNLTYGSELQRFATGQ